MFIYIYVILQYTCKFTVYFCKLTDMSRYVKNTGKSLLKNNKNLLQLGHNKVAGGPTSPVGHRDVKTLNKLLNPTQTEQHKQTALSRSEVLRTPQH